MTAASPANTPRDCLSNEVLEYLQKLGRSVCYSDGDLMVSRGETGRSFFVVLTGEVEVRLAGAGGTTLPLARLGVGATFGEMALLRGEPVSADVVAIGKATVLVCPELEFRRGLAECEPFRLQLMARLAGDLQRTTSEAWDFFQRAEALRLLTRCESRAEALIAESAAMQRLVRSLDLAAGSTTPCLITGESGTGKLLVARILHEKFRETSAPLIIVDCQRLEKSDARRLLLGPPNSKKPESSLTGLGAVHLARGGTLILHHVDKLERSLQKELAEIAKTTELDGLQLIATMRTDNSTGTRSASPQNLLAAVFADNTILVPPLRKRRRDIIALSRLFLSQIDPAKRLNRNAENTLVSMDFQRGNASQLRETVAFAARCTEGCEIQSEHIFSGIDTGEETPGIDLTPLYGLQLLLRRHSLSVIRATVLISFIATIAVCLGLPDSRVGRTANGFIWGVWEPVVFFLFLLVGSIWCTICPLSTAGRIVRNFVSLDKPPPQRLKKLGVWLMMITFFAIIWLEHVFHMIGNPPATAFLLLGLILASMAFCALYTREVWCRYVCPLGALATSLAPSAILEIGARSPVCTSTCTSHSCYKGEGPIPGCTVFQHPLNAAENHHCKLCLDCLKSCPNDSAKLFLRPPLAGIWKLGQTSGDIAPFAVAAFFLTLVFLAAQARNWPATPHALTWIGFAAIVAGAGLNRLLPVLLTTSGRDSDNLLDSRVIVQVSFGLMVLGWGPLMAYQFGNIPILTSLTLEAAPGSFWTLIPLPAPWTVLATLQIAVILLATVLATIAMARTHLLAKQRDTPLSPFGWTALSAFCATYVVIALFLVV